MSTMQDVFGPIISSYSRQQAIEDGILMQLSGPGYQGDRDIPDMVAEAGIKWPLAMTATAFLKYVCPIEGEGEKLAPCQDANGRLWDVLTMLRHAIGRSRQPGTELLFSVMVVPNVPEGYKKDHPPKARRVELKLISGPGDDAEPVLTIMLPEED